MPDLCPVCLGSGLVLGTGGWQFMPRGKGTRTSHSARCGRCEGKGWLPDNNEATHSEELESQVIRKILIEHTAGLNIDDIARISGLDIPKVYLALQKLRESGAIGVKNGSPVVYYAVRNTT